MMEVLCRIGGLLLYYILLFLVLQSSEANNDHGYEYSVKVFHFMIDHWGESKSGLQYCGNIACDWSHADQIKTLKDWLIDSPPTSFNLPTTTLAVYNIHSWWERTRETQPWMCELNTNFTLAESEESKVRYGQLFDGSFKYFDGYSTTHSASSLQRVYIESNFSKEDLHEAKNFSTLIKAGSYVASDCHKRDSANANRDGVIHQIRLEGFRVDGLGRCMHSIGPEGIELSKSKDTRYNLRMKRDIIGHFMFNMAFENSLEPGYVTEKPFDAMMGGTVPVYLGDSKHLKSLLPHPKAAIFVDDFPNITALVAYLTYLTKNETAYEEHRNWRHTYTLEENIKNKIVLQNTWFCRICQWAVNQTKLFPYQRNPQRTKCIVDPNAKVDETVKIEQVKTPPELEGKAVRGSTKEVYFVKHGKLHSVKDWATFLTLNIKPEDIVVLADSEMRSYIHGGDYHPSHHAIAVASSPHPSAERRPEPPAKVSPPSPPAVASPIVPVTAEPAPRVAHTKAPAELEGKAVHGSAKQVFLIKNGELHSIPDLTTFLSLKILPDDVITLKDEDLRTYVHGDPVRVHA